MQSEDRLEDKDIERRLEKLDDGWQVKDGKLYRLFEFDDFASAFSFMTRIAIVAEKRDHHPEWFNVYNRVEVWLTTHDAGAITQKDFDLAAAMDDAAR